MSGLSPGKLWGLRRLADESGRFRMLAVDQRPPLKSLISTKRGLSDAPYADVCAVKAALVDALSDHYSAVLLDPHYAYPAAIHLVPARCGLLLTLGDSIYAEDEGGRRSGRIDHWSVEQIKRSGADAVKVLAWYRPDAADGVIEHQQRFVAEVGADCTRFDIPFVLELLVYPLGNRAQPGGDYEEQPDKRVEHVLESVETFADPGFGVDLFKLESPIAAALLPEPGEGGGLEDRARDAFSDLARAASRPWVLLSAGASAGAFRRALSHAYAAGASGYLAGRAIWWDALETFPDMAAVRASLEGTSAPYMVDLNRMTLERALPWHHHPTFGDTGPRLADATHDLRRSYPGFGADR